MRKPLDDNVSSGSSKRRDSSKPLDRSNVLEPEEATQRKNDVELSHLLSSTLFAPGGERHISSVSGSSSRPVLNHRDTTARLMELSAAGKGASGSAGGSRAPGRGLGENLVRADKLSQIPSSIRTGIRSAEREKLKARIEREKELGNWHASIKHRIARSEGDALILDGRSRHKGTERDEKGRRRGLGLGVGKFKGGMLRLSKEEVGKMKGEHETRGAGRDTQRSGKSHKRKKS